MRFLFRKKEAEPVLGPEREKMFEISELEPPKPITLEDIKVRHTEDLIKAESDRIISLLLSHIKELNDSLSKKLDEFQKLEKSAQAVLAAELLKQKEKLKEEKKESEKANLLSSLNSLTLIRQRLSIILRWTQAKNSLSTWESLLQKP